MTQSLQSFVVFQDCKKVALQSGSRRTNGSVFFARVDLPPRKELRCDVGSEKMQSEGYPSEPFVG